MGKQHSYLERPGKKGRVESMACILSCLVAAVAIRTETRAPVRPQRAMMDGPLDEWMRPKRGLLLEGQKLREERSERGTGENGRRKSK